MDLDPGMVTEETAPIDYRLVCRTCLASDAEFYKLDSPIFVDDNIDEKPISFLECLRYCTRLSDGNDTEKLRYPIYICTECSASLQVSYNFIRNAVEAHEILRQKLGECTNLRHESPKGSSKSGNVEEIRSREDGVDKEVTKMRFRCKICNEKVETKKTLKEHVKLHLDMISYCCQLCSFECKKRSLLFDHYKLVHDMQPTREQLKPKTKQHDNSSIKKEYEPDYEDPISQEMEKIHNADVNEDYLHDTKNEEQEEQQELDIKLFLTPASSTASAAAAYIEAAVEATSADTLSDPTNTASLPTKDEYTSELQQYGTDQFNITANELSVGNEFIVMADGTVEEVMGNGVVIEYINAADDGVTLDNGLVLDNIMQVEQETDGDQQTVNDMDLDVDDIIIEERMGSELSVPSMAALTMGPETIVQTLHNLEDEMPPPSIITPNNVLTLKRIKCKICASNFHTQDELKNHMLTHNEIPHFFCDQCAFYTFFKIDLTQHYKTKHKLQPTQKQLQPKNKVRLQEQPTEPKHIYACDMCLFETRIKSHLRRHYLSKHQEEATEVQLRPTVDETASLSQSPPDSPPTQHCKTLRPDYPKGLNCKKCSKTFYWREKLKDHYRQHSMEEGNIKDNSLMSNSVGSNGPGTSLLKPNALHYNAATHDQSNVNSMFNVSMGHSNNYSTNGEPTVMDAQAIIDAAVAEAQAAAMQMNVQMNAPAPDIIMDIPVAATISTTTMPMNAAVSASSHIAMQQQQQHQQQPGAAMAVGYACQQIPSDAIPQIVETDTTIDNSELDFVFNDALFEDFEEDENEDEENEENDGADFQDLLLTSDDDFEDILQDQQQQQQQRDTNIYQPYCVHCNKKFLSQYQFENHMFVHRGLAPYRCEMCTNLYNTKRALIRHYRAVHKKMPSRDMIQAKGDKVAVDQTPIEHLDLIEQKAVTLMCAKCPLESVDLHIMRLHLNTTHGLIDENYILQKLPFECPRCIRSYASRARLLRHLERSHSVATIIQQQRAANNAMRNQLQQSESQQQHQYEPYVAIKDTATATTTTAVASSASTSLAVTSSSTATNTSCGRGIITHSYRFNSNDNNDEDDTEENSAGGVNEDSNNDKDVNNAVHEVVAATEVTPLSKQIADMEHVEKSNIGKLNATAKCKNKLATKQPITRMQRFKKPAIVATTKTRRKSATIADGGSIISLNIYHQLNENELFDEYACGMCAQSWRTAAQLHAHECIRNDAGSGEVSSKGGAAISGAAVENIGVGLITSERSQYLYKCNICQCNYKSSELLKHHMKRHTARIFRCVHCPKTYINRSELKAHQLTHTGEKPHKCEMCPKQFRYPHHLKRHCDVAHLGKRARCPVESCGRTFTTQAQLKIHGWIHDGKEPYRCKYCRHTFKKRESLRKHARRIHQCDLTEEEIAEIYRQSVGHTNPHDFTVSLSNGSMQRRSDVEQAAQRPQKHINALAAESAASDVATVDIVQTDVETTTELSPLLASNSHNNMNIKLEMGVEVEDETVVAAVTHVSRNSTTLPTHEEALHTYMLPGMEEHGQLPHFKLESSGSF